MATLVANSDGVIVGKFTIPEKVPAGVKQVEFVGSGGSYGEAQFFGEGTLVTTTRQRVHAITTITRFWPLGIDPLAQTFMLPQTRHIGAVDLFVVKKGTTPIIVQIRNTSTGFPNREILAEARLHPGQIAQGAWNRFTLDHPVWAMANAEYALVVLCNDADTEVGVAEMGKYDSVANRWVTQQPYQVGVLLSSSNASTWTAHQDRDLAFRLLARKYSGAQKVVELGTIEVTDATDVMVMAMTDSPADGATAKLRLTLPDNSIVEADGEQVIRFDTETTGEIKVEAVLTSTDHASGSIIPGTQIIAGTIQEGGDYITRAIDADALGVDVRVIFDAILPSSSSVKVYVSGIDEGDSWTEMSQDGIAKPLGDGLFEYQYVATGVTEARIRIKIELAGTAAARPMIGNLRVSVVEAA